MYNTINTNSKYGIFYIHEFPFAGYLSKAWNISLFITIYLRYEPGGKVACIFGPPALRTGEGMPCVQGLSPVAAAAPRRSESWSADTA